MKQKYLLVTGLIFLFLSVAVGNEGDQEQVMDAEIENIEGVIEDTASQQKKVDQALESRSQSSPYPEYPEPEMVEVESDKEKAAEMASDVGSLKETAVNETQVDPMNSSDSEQILTTNKSSVVKKKKGSVIVGPSGDSGVDLGPEEDARQKGLYKLPPGPVQGGVLKVPHPGAAKGLLRINKDRSYQYRTALKPKSQAMSVRLGAMTPPDVKGPTDQITFQNMYGKQNLMVLHLDYEWEALQKFGSFGVQLGTGFGYANGKGTLESSGAVAEESYNLFIVPLSAFLIYRFEYVRRQLFVPFVNGGVTYYGLAEKRDDNKPIQFAGALAAGGGGGIHLSISRLDPASAFTLDREYGIADMWFTLEARLMQGLDKSKDFTNQTISLGVTLDY